MSAQGLNVLLVSVLAGAYVAQTVWIVRRLRDVERAVKRLDVRLAWIVQRLDHIEDRLGIERIPEPKMTTEEG